MAASQVLATPRFKKVVVYTEKNNVATNLPHALKNEPTFQLEEVPRRENVLVVVHLYLSKLIIMLTNLFPGRGIREYIIIIVF